MDIITTAAVLYSIKRGLDSIKMNEQAETKLQKAYALYAEQADEVERHKVKANQSLEKLVNRKKGMFSFHMQKFADVYGKIREVQFLPSDGIDELFSDAFTIDDIANLRAMISTTMQSLSTAQEVSAYLFGGIGNLLYKSAEQELKVADNQFYIARLYNGQAQLAIKAIDAMKDRADDMSKLLAQASALLYETLRATEEIIERNGTDRNKYTVSDRMILQNCVNQAKFLKSILDVPFLGEDGSVATEALNILDTGNARLAALQSGASTQRTNITKGAIS